MNNKKIFSCSKKIFRVVYKCGSLREHLEFIHHKKSQAWGIDLMTASAIFFVALVVFFIFSINQTGEARSIVEDLLYDGKVVSNSILSSGFPDDWTEGDVVRIGITSDNKINDTKLENFYNLAQTDYARTKSIFSIKYDYYFFLEDNMTIDSELVDGIGKPGTSRTNIIPKSKNLIKITRFTIYGEKPTTAYIYIWEE